jgi:hypothetical protein
MPLTSITIENFKGIGERVTIPLRPITLLFGANSAGKSTILQGLLYLRELLERKNADADVLSGCGGAINLGGFHEFVHGHDLNRIITIGATVTVDDDGLPEYVVADEEMPQLPRAYGTLRSEVKTAGVEVAVEFAPLTGPRIRAYRVYLNGQHSGTISAEPGREPIVRIPETGCLYREIFLEDEDEDYPVAKSTPEEEEAEAEPELDVDEEAELEHEEEPLQAGRDLDYVGPHDVSFEGLTVVPDFGKALGRLQFSHLKELAGLGDAQAREIFSQVLVGVGDLVLEELSRVRYIGPIRRTPSRSFRPLKSRDPGRWADGSAAWDLLYGADQRLHWLDVQAINNLGLGYRLETGRKFEVSAEGLLGKALQRAKLGLADPFEDLDRVPESELQQIKEKVHFELVSEVTGVQVQPVDVGIGVSQVLPVVVGSMAPGSRVFVVEQPELHLHPKVQCNLADILIASMHSKPDFIQLLETHSEHLMLRLMRRIRETANNQQPDARLQLKNDQVQVLFVESFEGRSIFRPMPLNDKGELVQAWPGGFFEEDLDEVL